MSKALVSTFFQWIHLTAAVLGVGGMGFVLFCLLPAARRLAPAERDALFKNVFARFRWVAWTVILLLIGSGLYNVGLVWEAPWGTYWKFLTLKIALALAVFFIVLCLTIPLRIFDRFRARRGLWLSIAFGIAVGVILISAYLRRG
jgi:uncharacterized membrane protein